jgi:oligopeptide transport system substrate-binding protein
MYTRECLMSAVALAVAATLLGACAPPAEPEVVEIPVTRVVEVKGETTVETVRQIVTATPEPTPKPMRPNILRTNFGQGDIPTLDPALCSATGCVQIAERLYVGLTRLNRVTLEVEPGMAHSWEISPDGLTYVFKLHEGIPWVRWNGTQVEQVLDCDGNVRYVTAHDFEYGIKRSGIPDTGSGYAYVLALALEGLDDLLYAEGWDDLSAEERQALIDGVQATALDDYTLEMTFTNPAVYNLNIAGMWMAYAVPRWIIEGDACTQARGERWFEPGFNQSFGPYALQEWVHDSYILVTRNPFWPGVESTPWATIEKVKAFMLADSAAFAEYEAGNMDVGWWPTLAALDRIRADPVLSQELVIAPAECTYFYGFNTAKPPVDNVHLRRALSHAIDRQGLVENVLKAGQQPAQWFCRPGMAGCPTMDSHPDAGIKSNPEAARAELQAYLDEMGYSSVKEIPEIILMYDTGEGHKRIVEAIAEMWKETLGIEVTITNQEVKVYLMTLDGNSPHIWRLGWCMDYPDANNWTREVFACGGFEENATMWCNEEFTAMLEEAALEPDPVKRQQMYVDAEDILVYEDAAIAPIYWYTTVQMHKSYVHGPISTGAWEKYSLDLELE